MSQTAPGAEKWSGRRGGRGNHLAFLRGEERLGSKEQEERKDQGWRKDESPVKRRMLTISTRSPPLLHLSSPPATSKPRTCSTRPHLTSFTDHEDNPAGERFWEDVDSEQIERAVSTKSGEGVDLGEEENDEDVDKIR
jgi:hypothetical protein